MITESRDLQQ